MGEMAIDRSQSALVDGVLRDEMARGNRALRSLAPVIGHMLDTDGPSLFGDAIIARVRGMLRHLSRQLIGKPVEESSADPLQYADLATLEEKLASDDALINHLYCVALEGQLTQKLERSAAIDPVLSPLMQELIASDKPEIAELAMSVLAAQSRFSTSERRMELPLGELPNELFSAALGCLETAQLSLERDEIERSATLHKSQFDEAHSRTGLLARLSHAMGEGAIAALELEHAGLALFASAAASLTQQSRDRTIFACHEGQGIRLALILRSAGVQSVSIGQQLDLLGSSKALPRGFEGLSQNQARETLRELGEV